MFQIFLLLLLNRLNVKEAVIDLTNYRLAVQHLNK